MLASNHHLRAVSVIGLFAAGCVGGSPPGRDPEAARGAAELAAASVRLADTVVDAPGATGTGFGDPARAVNGVRGAGNTSGSVDVFSLGYTPDQNDHITLAWSNGRLQNGLGADLAVFENPFLFGGGTFMDLIIVEVSIDGVEFRELAHDYAAANPAVYAADPALWQGFAGRTPVRLNADSNPVDPFDAAAAGGDAFDLDSVVGDDALAQAIRADGVRFVRLVSAPARIDPDTGARFVHAAISNGADIDGVYGRYVTDESSAAASRAARADDIAVDAARRVQIADYVERPGFDVPGSGGPADVEPDGRILVLSGSTVFRETAPSSRAFVALGELPDADLSEFGASFLKISPDGSRIAVGNEGGASFDHFQVGVFTIASLTGAWFDAASFQAAWIDDRFVALTAGTFGSPSLVTALDTLSADPLHPSNRTIIDNIGGASGGIAFDHHRNLYTGNGFAISGPSTTGTVKAFRRADWRAALRGGSPLDFEAQGTPIVTALSAAPLAFDAGGNLFVGGADFGGGDIDFAAFISRAAVRSALAGGGPVDTSDPAQARKVDPDPAADSAYGVIVNPQRDEVYLTGFGPHAFVFRAR
jgi:hypothetical protein